MRKKLLVGALVVFCIALGLYFYSQKEPAIPGRDAVNGPWGNLLTDNITMRPGETKEVLYEVEVWEDVPPKYNFLFIWRVSEPENFDEIPMPEGLKVNNPSFEVTPKPYENYILKIIVEASSELSPGEYVLLVWGDDPATGVEWLTVIVNSAGYKSEWTKIKC